MPIPEILPHTTAEVAAGQGRGERQIRKVLQTSVDSEVDFIVVYTGTF